MKIKSIKAGVHRFAVQVPLLAKPLKFRLPPGRTKVIAGVCGS